MSDLPLAARRILLPRRWSAELASALSAAGALVDEVQLIDRRPVANPALAGLPARIASGEIDWLAITSAFTVTALAELGRPLSLLCPGTLAVAAVGPASAAAVRRALGRTPLQPSSGTGGDALASAFPDGPGTVVVPGALQSAPPLGAGLRRKGWLVDEIGVYRSVALPATAIDPAIRLRWRDGHYDALVVTSPSVAVAAAAGLGPGPVVAVGEASAAAAVRAGFTAVATSRSATASDLTATLAAFLN